MLFKGESREITDVGIGLLLSVVGVSQLFTQTCLLRRLARRFDEGELVVMGSVLRTIGIMRWMPTKSVRAWEAWSAPRKT